MAKTDETIPVNDFAARRESLGDQSKNNRSTKTQPVKNGTERKMPGESRILSGSCESPATRDPMKKSLSNLESN